MIIEKRKSKTLKLQFQKTKQHTFLRPGPRHQLLRRAPRPDDGDGGGVGDGDEVLQKTIYKNFQTPDRPPLAAANWYYF